MDKAQLKRLEGTLCGASSILYLIENASAEENWQDVKQSCKLVADIINEVRAEMTQAYCKLVCKEGSGKYGKYQF